jgi:invasion protein IalB
MQMKKITALFVASAFVLGTGFASAAPSKTAAKPAESKKDDKAKDAKDSNVFGNWRLNCNKAEGATQEICELDYVFAAKAQADAANPDPKPQILLTIGIVKPANSPVPVMIMRADLGAFLQPAPMIKVPGHKDVVAQFLTCNQRGCTTVPVGLEKEFVDAMKATEAAITKDPKAPGATVSIGARQTNADKKVQFGYLPMALDAKGFAKGLAALEAKSPAAPAAAAPTKDAPKKK